MPAMGPLCGPFFCPSLTSPRGSLLLRGHGPLLQVCPALCIPLYLPLPERTHAYKSLPLPIRPRYIAQAK